MEFIESENGKDKLIYNGYMYTFEKFGTEEKSIWKCDQYKKMKCKGRIHSLNNEVLKEIQHNHVQDCGNIEAAKAVNLIKNMATQNVDLSTRAVISSASTSLTSAAAGQMPSVSVLKRTVRRIRQKEQAAPPNPKTLLELIIPDDYGSTFDGKPFLLFDSGPVENRILIFFTQKNLQLLQKCEHWFADGTFSTSPNLFYQIYTVHGIQFNNVFPSIFALLLNKTETTYVNFYNALKTLNESLNPKSIMVDFEKAAINAIQSVFTNTSVRGCFFHLSQSIWRRLQNLGFQKRYMEDSEFALQIRMMAALSFVPEEDVENAWNELLDSEFYSLNEEILTPLTNYFEDTWIGRLDRRNRRKPALFPVTLWNCHKYIFENIPRTNNSVEGWHNGFASSLNACHPTTYMEMYRFVQKGGESYEVTNRTTNCRNDDGC